YRTIRAALDAVKLGQTVRVLDDAVYPEPIFLARTGVHMGVTVEAIHGATIAPKNAQASVVVMNVPDVTIRGFHIMAESAGAICLAMVGNASGTTAEDLDITPDNGVMARGISLEQLQISETDRPVTIRNCRFRGLAVAIRASGIGDNTHTPQTCRNI